MVAQCHVIHGVRQLCGLKQKGFDRGERVCCRFGLLPKKCVCVCGALDLAKPKEVLGLTIIHHILFFLFIIIVFLTAPSFLLLLEQQYVHLDLHSVWFGDLCLCFFLSTFRTFYFCNE